MTSRSLSWIDRGRWAGLLAKVTDLSVPEGRPAPRLIPAPRSTPSATTPPPAPRRVGSATTPPPVAPPRPRATTAPPPLPMVPPPPPIKPAGYRPFLSSSRHLEERLQALVLWIEDCVPCRAAFIADDNGLPVVEHLGAEPGHVAAASSVLLMLASVRTLMRDSGGWLSLKLGSQVLNVVEVATRWGRFGIGVVTDEALPRDFLVALSVAVERAFHGESSQGESA